MAKQSRADKALKMEVLNLRKLMDQRIERAYGASCSGVTIDIMDIGKVFEYGRIKIAQGEDDAALAASIRAYVNTLAK